MGSVGVDGLADAVMQALEEYKDLATEDMKEAIVDAGKSVREQIKNTAPKDTGKYAKSWRDKKTMETADSLEVTVHSPSRYRIAHLLENGHAKRGGGRVKAIPHIKPAEEAGEAKLLADIQRRLSGH